MKTSGLIFLMLLILPSLALAGDVSPNLERLMDQSADETLGVWVYFQDKGLADTEIQAALKSETLLLSQKALSRRAKVYAADQLTDLRDLPVFAPYIEEALASGATVRRSSRWFNATSFNANREQILAMAALPFVQRIEPVARFQRSLPAPFVGELPEREENKAAETVLTNTLDYGGSIWGAELINVPPVHDQGLSGDGVVVGVLDAGFMLNHEAFQHLPILAQWDFVHNDDNVQWQEGDHEWQDHHGGQVLSTIMGFADGKLVGTAYGASAILAMTEDTGDETIVEEDNWIAAVEWVEGQGADIVTSSLGYYYWYEFSDLDGDTALITRAADMAVERGMSVFTSAGNERNNTEWPHLTAPADGDSVIAVGAVDYTGALASFSSPGPTFDGRIKPDLCAMGVGTHVASYYSYNAFGGANGTSFAAPQVAGIAALMLERIPQLTPMQIREAMHASGSQNRDPDNDFGYGILDAASAVAYWGATINHTPLSDTEDEAGPYLVTAEITARTFLDQGNLWLNWRADGGMWQQVALSGPVGSEYTASIPGAIGGGLVEYFLTAGDDQGYVIDAPFGGAANPWSFQVGQDVTDPELYHPSLTDQIVGTWPPVLRAEVSDNQGIGTVEVRFQVNGGAQQGPHALNPGDEAWELAFPLESNQIQPGDVINYTIEVRDTALVPNTAASGPHEMRVVDSLGKILIIDDLENQSAQKDEQAAKNLANDFQGWLEALGYEVDLTATGSLTGAMLEWADVAFLTSGNNLYPVGDSGMRAKLMTFADNGGHILIEGGETAAAAFFENQYLDFAQTVLHTAEWQGDLIGSMNQAAGQSQHAFLNRPNALPDILAQDMSPAPYDYASSDILLPDSESMVIYTSLFNSSVGGVLLHDNNTGAEGGQIVFLSLDLGYMPDDLAIPLLENCLTYLAGRESSGNSALAGTITLSGSSDASGVVVSVDDEHSAITGPDGAFFIDGLHGATYSLTASKEGYGSETITVELDADQMVSGLEITLQAVTMVAMVDEVGLALPDNNSTGLEREIVVSAAGAVQSISVDMDLDHGSVGQLEVTLTSPTGTVVTLHDNTGGISDDLIGNWPATLLVDGPGSLDDFLAESAQGTWILKVADTGWGVLGTWNSWGLNLGVAQPTSAVGDDVPLATRVVGNYPNPFNPRTTVKFEMQQAGPAELAIYNIQGRLVRTFGTEVWAAGRHELVWDGNDSRGRAQSSGLYFFRLKTADVSQAYKMTLVR